MAPLIVTTDLSPESKRVFGPARELAAKLDLRIKLVAVLEDVPFEPSAGGMIAAYPDREQVRKDWSSELEKVKHELGDDCDETVVIDAVDVPNAIVDYANKSEAAFICMATHGRSGLRRLLLGSVAELVIRHSRIPVIVYPPTE